jgi:hypothetical protein
MSNDSPLPDDDLASQEIESILADVAASTWLKTALDTALVRDPLDAANDAELLAAVLSSRANAMLAAVR